MKILRFSINIWLYMYVYEMIQDRENSYMETEWTIKSHFISLLCDCCF